MSLSQILPLTVSNLRQTSIGLNSEGHSVPRAVANNAQFALSELIGAALRFRAEEAGAVPAAGDPVSSGASGASGASGTVGEGLVEVSELAGTVGIADSSEAGGATGSTGHGHTFDARSSIQPYASEIIRQLVTSGTGTAGEAAPSGKHTAGSTGTCMQCNVPFVSLSL